MALTDQQLVDLQGQASTRSTMPSASYLALLAELRASRAREAQLAEEVRRLQAELDSQDDFHPEDEALIEAYLSFLRGTGPCPDISALATDSQQRMREQFAILAALTARDAEPDVPTEARS